MARTRTREWKPRDEYLKDKIKYHEAKLAYEYDQLSQIDPDWMPNLVPNPDLQPRQTRATVQRPRRVTAQALPMD